MRSILVAAVLLAACSGVSAQEIEGRWALDHEASTAIDPWRNLEIAIASDGTHLALVRTWSSGARRVFADSIRVQYDQPAQFGVTEFPERGHLAAFPVPGTRKRVTARRGNGANDFAVHTEIEIGTSQGSMPVNILSEYVRSEDGATLTVREHRSTRPTPMTFVLRRVEN